MKNRNNCRFGQIAKVMNMALAKWNRSKGKNVASGCVCVHAYSVLFPWSGGRWNDFIKKG